MAADSLIESLDNSDLSDYPPPDELSGPLDISLWLLSAIKDLTDRRKLSSSEMATLSRRYFEISLSVQSIEQALRNAGDRVHVHDGEAPTTYEIMRSGREYIQGLTLPDEVNLYRFEPGEEFTSKQTLSSDIFMEYESPLRISDPYVGPKTLDLLASTSIGECKVITRLDNLSQSQKESFLRTWGDFRNEYSHVSIRDFDPPHLHDRYILSQEALILVGHSLKDLGGKESFGVVLSHDETTDIQNALLEVFNRRWKQASTI